jgi:hypothetical protein
MFSGTTFTRASGKLLGAHQKIDRLADKQLQDLLGTNTNVFPPINDILHFEGNNGPDAIKRKSPSKDEPWHYFQPYNPKDTGLTEIIKSHYLRLIESLKQKDEVRASFEAAWLAHAMVDGLTPAHHYPYGEKVVELRGGAGLESRRSIKDKLMMPGETIFKLLTNNWKFWGPKGLFMTHAAFEMGIATLIRPMRFKRSLFKTDDLLILDANNIDDWFRTQAKMVVDLDLYKRFYDKGWTRSLSRDIKFKLLPLIVNCVAVAWYGAARSANEEIIT